MKIRRIAAIWAAKVIRYGCILSGKQGVTLAGKAALKIDPDILRDLASQVKKEILVVCGTNGKTTTNNLLCSFLEAEGNRVVCNHTGSNMLNGVAAAFVLKADLLGRLKADYACIEIDEASTVRVFPYFKPDRMVLTNLFRDQLDRYGEIDTTMELLKKALQMSPDTKLLVNGDDALSYYLALESGHAFDTFGVEEAAENNNDSKEVKEGQFCKRCGCKLDYDFYHFSQLGKYHCPQCGFARPKLTYNASNIQSKERLSFRINEREMEASYRGFYNVYNILAAYGAADLAGLPLKHMDQVLNQFKPENGRNEMFQINGTRIILNLAKNPAGFNQNIASVMEDTSPKDVIIVINDNAQDGTDISWLWDVDYDLFADESIRSIAVSGIRGQDMRLRLKYVDIASNLFDNVELAIEDRLKNGCKNLYVLVNYTALYSTHQLLKKMEQKDKYGNQKKSSDKGNKKSGGAVS